MTSGPGSAASTGCARPAGDGSAPVVGSLRARSSTVPASHVDPAPVGPGPSALAVGADPLAHDRARVLVVAEAEVHGVAQAILVGPLGEGDLGDQVGLDPDRLRPLGP